MVQWLRIHTSKAGNTNLIPGQGTDPPCHTVWSKKKKIGEGMAYETGKRGYC